MAKSKAVKPVPAPAPVVFTRSQQLVLMEYIYAAAFCEVMNQAPFTGMALKEQARVKRAEAREAFEAAFSAPKDPV